jgi:hypothetical protein
VEGIAILVHQTKVDEPISLLRLVGGGFITGISGVLGHGISPKEVDRSESLSRTSNRQNKRVEPPKAYALGDYLSIP